jgi:hypothetical protein
MTVDKELFHSAIRSKGDLAGVFEYDGVAGYFYLYDLNQEEGSRVVGSIRILSADTDLVDEDVSVRWDTCEERVGLFLRGTQWAVFNAIAGTKHGGDFDIHMQPDIPREEKFS